MTTFVQVVMSCLQLLLWWSFYFSFKCLGK